jgi:methionyl-tRNA formyltransferase
MARVVLFSYGPVIRPLRSLLTEVGAELVAIVLPSNRSDAALADALRDASGVRVLVQPPRADATPFASELSALEPDLFLVWHYSLLLPPSVLAVPRLGSVNLHGGLLPDYRGGHVLQWAIVNGEPETGVTLHYVDAGIDTGPVIGEARIAIGDDDDAASVACALEGAGLRLLRDRWEAIAAGTAPATPQPPGGRHWPLRTPADSAIDWTKPAARIRNLVRALVPPWPGATCRLGDSLVVVDRADVVDGTAEPGTILDVGKEGIVIAAGERAVLIRAARRDGEAVGLDALGVRAGDRVTQ